MNPRSDDALVRQLASLTERTLPPMSLDADRVLLAGRRRKRRSATFQSVGVVAVVAAVALGVVQGLPSDQARSAPPAGIGREPGLEEGQAMQIAPGVVAVNRPIGVNLDDGTTILALGISLPDAQGTSQPLILASVTAEQLSEANASEVHPAWDGGVRISQGDSRLEVPGARFLWSSAAAPDDEDFRWDTMMRTDAAEWGSLFIGVVPAWLKDPRVVLYSSDGFRQGDGSVVHSREVPLYAAPTDDGRLLYTVWVAAAADGSDGPAADITASLAIGSDGVVVPGQRCATLTLDECAGAFGSDIYAAAASGPVDVATPTPGLGTLRLETATDVQPIKTDAGPGFDLGVQAGSDPAKRDLRYALRWGDVPEAAGSTRRVPGLWVATLRPDGSTVMAAGGSIDGDLVPIAGSPVAMTYLSDHEVFVLGFRPPAPIDATLELVVATKDREVRKPIPTFRLPGLDGEVWFAKLSDPEVNFRDWPTATFVVTANDGTVTRWSLHGDELFKAVPETPPEG